MRKVWDGTEGEDGYLARGRARHRTGTEATIEQAQRFHDEIDRPNL